MKICIYIVLVISMLGSCRDSNEKETVTAPDFIPENSVITVPAENAVSEKTVSFLNETAFSRFVRDNASSSIDWNRFALKGFWKEDFRGDVPFEPPRKYYDLYGKLLKYSPDSSMFIDLDSYGITIRKDQTGRLIREDADPDSEVSLINVKTRQKKRLLFFGPGSSIEDAAWIDNEGFILLGYETGGMAGSSKAIIYRFDMAAETGYLYELEDSSTVRQLQNFSRERRLKHIIRK